MAGDLDSAAMGRKVDDDDRRSGAVVGGGEAGADADRVTHEAPPVLGGSSLEHCGDTHAGSFPRCGGRNVGGKG
jgi:hypothetical protein